MRPDIEGIKADFEQAREEVSDLYDQSRAWTRSVPARDDDSDRVITRALDHESALLAYIEELEAALGSSYAVVRILRDQPYHPTNGDLSTEEDWEAERKWGEEVWAPAQPVIEAVYAAADAAIEPTEEATG